MNEVHVSQPLGHRADWRKLERIYRGAGRSYVAQDIRQRINNLIQNQGESRAGATGKPG